MIYEKDKLRNISFPLGGIGTGCIGLSGNGELKDWEIFNRPNKNTKNGFSHFAITANYKGKNIAKVLHGDTTENYIGTSSATIGNHGYGYGVRGTTLAGFPHFKNVSFDGNFPVAKLKFSDSDFPANVTLCAFNPLIPHDEFNSSLPAAFFEWEIENTANEDIEFSLGCTVRNPAESSTNKKVSNGNLNGLLLSSEGLKDTDIKYSDLCILTDSKDLSVQEYWYRGIGNYNLSTYWENLSNLKRIPERCYETAGKNDHGTVVSYITVPAKKIAKLRFIISWNVPTGYNYWDNDSADNKETRTWRNYYATQFKNSFATACYALENFDELLNKTLLFSNSLQDSTLPDFVKDAVSANLSVIKTATALRVEDGSFWGWEGCSETTGSCFGNCQHVWNYAYVLPYLFPKLERSVREMTLKYALQENGATGFRVNLPLKNGMDTERPCLDGQMGEVIKCYREWLFSGNDEWLKSNAENIFKMLEFAWSDSNPDKWDSDRDGVLEGRQHHTLDVELFGPCSWLQGMYLLALDCGAKMAKHLGQTERALLYTEIYNKGKAWTNENLFNGEYFYHKIDLSNKAMLDKFGAVDLYWHEDKNEIKYQIADGCIIDQMLSDWHAVLIGADGIFDADKKRKALESLYKYNYNESMRNVLNIWRIFALNDESGTIICSYPEHIKKPALPIPYTEETMTGFEYALAGLMIAEGYVTEGETLIKAVRDRYDGEKRNPWNELECGSNYARSMASYALMQIYSGFTYDMTKKHIAFAPIYKAGKYLFSVCDSWGVLEYDNNQYKLSLLGNPLTLNSICTKQDSVTKVIVDGNEADFKLAEGKIMLNGIKIEKEIIIK